MIPNRFQPLFDFPDLEGPLSNLLWWLKDKTYEETEIPRWEDDGGANHPPAEE